MVVNMKRKIIFCDTWKLYEIQISVSTSKVLLEHSRAHSFMYCLWVLSSYNSRVEQLWEKLYDPLSLKHSLPGSLQKKLWPPVLDTGNTAIHKVDIALAFLELISIQDIILNTVPVELPLDPGFKNIRFWPTGLTLYDFSQHWYHPMESDYFFIKSNQIY